MLPLLLCNLAPDSDQRKQTTGLKTHINFKKMETENKLIYENVEVCSIISS